ncbi:MAG: GNAT family N-acetyltransferase [Herpetosiphonaceae bacterium]|nr:GNAT family N-acetyltransferase [Herpetosiphonaceae bacterium]
MPTLRTATPADWTAIQNLIRAAEPVDRAARVALDGSVPWQPMANWEVFVAEQAASIVGFGALLWPTQDNCHAAELLIHPNFRRQGLGTRLARQLLARADERGIGLLGEYQGMLAGAAPFMQTLGATEVGRWHEMVADPLPRSLEARPLPDGYTIRHAVAGQDEAVFADIFRDSFSEHRFMSTPPVESVRERWSNPQFDGNGYALAEYAGEVVGVSAIRAATLYRGNAMVTAGHIGPVGVRAGHRQRGLARALMIDNLRHAAQVGWETASLSVDEVNLQAQALYRSLGFVRQHDWVWWKIKR